MPVSKTRYILVLSLLILGLALFFITTDREYINLTPTEGTATAITLRSEQRYVQTFVATRRNLSRLGIFLRPAARDLPDDDVVVTIWRGTDRLAEGKIAAAFIDAQGPTQIRFASSVPTSIGETLAFEIVVPPTLSGKLRVQPRLPDETFSNANVTFRIDGVDQPHPLAYQVFYRYRPPFAWQVGGLLVVAAAWLMWQQWLRRFGWIAAVLYAMTVSVLFIIPAVLLGSWSWPTYLYAVVALLGMFWLLISDGAEVIPALLGAHVFAFTTWLPSHAQVGRERYAVLALLPWLFLLTKRGQNRLSSKHRLALLIGCLILATVVFSTLDWQPIISRPTVSASIRDILFDPNQVQSANKLYPAFVEGWDNFSSYVGVISGGLAIIGMAWQARRHVAVALIGLVGVWLALVAPMTAWAATRLPLPPQHFIILLTFALAYFAGWGLMGMRRYFGSGPLVTSLLSIIMVIALLDLWQVAIATMEFGLL